MLTLHIFLFLYRRNYKEQLCTYSFAQHYVELCTETLRNDMIYKETKSCMYLLQYIYIHNEYFIRFCFYNALICKDSVHSLAQLYMAYCNYTYEHNAVCKGGHTNYFCLSANRRSANSWTHSAIANPQISEICQSSDRKSANCYISGRSANKKIKFADLRFAELICEPPTFGYMYCIVKYTVH